MLAIKDLNNEVYPLTGASKIKRVRRVNGEKELSLMLDKTKQNAHFFDDIEKLWRVIDFNGEEYPVLLYRDIAVGEGYVREISCLHSFFDDMRNHVVYEMFSSSKTFVDMMNFIFNGSGYTYNIVDLFYAQEFENFGDDYGLELFKTALERYGAEFTVDGKVVTLRTKIGDTTDFQYRHKFNLESIERQVDALDFSTYGEGYGKNGLKVVYESPLMAIYGKRPIKAIRDERFTMAQSLTDRVAEAVDSTLKIALTVKLSDLHASGYNKNHPNEGDTIILVDDRLGLKIDTRIVEIAEVLHPNGTVLDCDVMLSNFSNIFEQQRRIHNATKTIADAVEGKRPLPFQALAYAVQQATIALQKAQTELVFPENGGILAISKDNPNVMVLFNSAGIGVSQDGGQTFPEAITGYGINATAVTTGTLNTALVRIEGATGKMFITGDQFKSISLMDDNQYVEILPGVINIEGGGINIKRPDGYTVVNNGILSSEFAIDAHDPPFQDSTVTINGIWKRTSATDPANFNAYFYLHDSRYIKIRFALHDSGTGLGARLSVYEIGNGGALLGQRSVYSVTSGQAIEETLIIDVGVPTGAERGFYIKLNTNAGGEASGRVLKKTLSG